MQQLPTKFNQVLVATVEMGGNPRCKEIGPALESKVTGACGDEITQKLVHTAKLASRPIRGL